MLVLSRKVGERLLIGDNISVTIVSISGYRVRLGIEAPEDMAVLREELQSTNARVLVRLSRRRTRSAASGEHA
ncbi:MAG TPA: carbon storage regulator [Gemmataceae bacterium]|nr:carbon storage regulator [Gemmataceae bacterium]